MNESSLSNNTARSWRVRWVFHFTRFLPLLPQCPGWYCNPMAALNKLCLTFVQSTQMQLELSTDGSLISNQMRPSLRQRLPQEESWSRRSIQTPSWYFYPPENFNCAPQIKHKENHSFILHFFHVTKDDKQNEISSKKLLKRCKRKERRLKTYFKWTYKWNLTTLNSR